ncbi:uncharacterized protein JCM15063_006243 [Sporobolomyces koalae]|uniref:uncharacterized protein n=1 Tax=Sporobolomyces koalae TaxID=500713 RepID=UPI0031791CA3
MSQSGAAASSSRQVPPPHIDQPEQIPEGDGVINETIVRDLVNHFFANPQPSSHRSLLDLISPHLTISLPYLPLSAPTSDTLLSRKEPNLARSTSARSLALYHLPLVAVDTLPRSAWRISIDSINSPDLATSAERETWSVQAHWTLKFGSLAGAGGARISDASLSFQAGKPLDIEQHDEWTSIGDPRTIQLVFASTRGENKKQLVQVLIKPQAGSITPFALFERLPESIQPFARLSYSKIVAPIFLYFAVGVLKYLGLDQATARLRLPPGPPVPRAQQVKAPPSHPKRKLSSTIVHQEDESHEHKKRARSRSIEQIATGSALQYTTAQTIPTRDELEALQILQGSHEAELDRSPQALSPVTEPATTLSNRRPGFVEGLLSIPIVAIMLSLVHEISIALVFETSDLYYLIKRLVVLFTELVMALSGNVKDTVLGSDAEPDEEESKRGRKRNRELYTSLVKRGKEKSESPVRLETPQEEESEIQSIKNAEKDYKLDLQAIARGSPPLSPTPPTYHHPRLRGKRVSFPTLFATVIPGVSPQVSLPPSPSHSPAPSSTVPDSEIPAIEESGSTRGQDPAARLLASSAQSSLRRVAGTPSPSPLKPAITTETAILEAWDQVVDEIESQAPTETRNDTTALKSIEDTDAEVQGKRSILIEQEFWNERQGVSGQEEQEQEQEQVELNEIVVEQVVDNGKTKMIDHEQLGKIESQIDEARQERIKQALEESEHNVESITSPRSRDAAEPSSSITTASSSATASPLELSQPMFRSETQTTTSPPTSPETHLKEFPAQGLKEPKNVVRGPRGQEEEKIGSSGSGKKSKKNKKGKH